MGVAVCTTIVIPILILLACELFVRIRHNAVFSTSRPRRQLVEKIRAGLPADADKTFGWTPRPNYSSKDNSFRYPVTIDDRGFRSNGNRGQLEQPTIVAVGDSCTWGEDVLDTETWPSHAERILGIRVRNGGVWGYGVDQIVLRAESILNCHHPDWLLFCIVADDVRRCEFSYKFAWWKPYFSLDNGQLVFHEAPILQPAPEARNFLPRLLEHSYFMHAVFMRTIPILWCGTNWFDRHEHDQGREVAAALFKRLAARATRTGTRLILIIYAPDRIGGDYELLAPMFHEAKAAGIPVIDLIPRFKAALAADPDIEQKWYVPWGHMNSRGNHWVAKNVVKELAAIESLRGDGLRATASSQARFATDGGRW